MQKNHTVLMVTLVAGSWLSTTANAVPFGAFDPRSLAMGGAGVASGTSENAAYYNPALMAMYKTRKERGGNSRFMLPVTTLRISDSVETVVDLDDEQLEQRFVDSIAAYENVQNSATARAVLEAATDLQNNLNNLRKAPVHADAIAGMIFSIGHKYEGGAIIINKRWVGDGAVENFDSDLQLLGDFVGAMEFIEAGGDPVDAAALYPDVFDNGQIAYQTGDLTSEAAGSGLIITEVGMAMSRQFNVYGKDIAFGITPKVVQVTTYDLSADAATGSSQNVRDDNEDFDINLDFGIAHQIDDRWRTGIVVKNMRSSTYKTSLGNEIEIEPQVRGGMSYDLGRRGLYAFDIDLIENDAVGTGSPSQVMSLGVEWPLAPLLKVRGGIARNMKGLGTDNEPYYSLGAHWGLGVIIDAAVAWSDYEKAAGFQVGTRF